MLPYARRELAVEAAEVVLDEAHADGAPLAEQVEGRRGEPRVLVLERRDDEVADLAARDRRLERDRDLLEQLARDQRRRDRRDRGVADEVALRDVGEESERALPELRVTTHAEADDRSLEVSGASAPRTQHGRK